MTVSMDVIVSLCKRRGIIFPGSEIYNGLGGTFDYGPIGVELKQNVKRAWWKAMVYERDDMEGLDCAILMHPKVWEASGHVEGFTDPLCDCKECKKRFRADHIEEAEYVYFKVFYMMGDASKEQNWTQFNELILGRSKKDAKETAKRKLIAALGSEPAIKVEQDGDKTIKAKRCPECCGELTDARMFNLMFRTFVGPVEDSASVVYLRPETAQGIFVNYENIRQTMRRKIPFGIAQIGKSFRNEITPRNFIFRTREFEQMEIEFFCKPGTDEEWYEYWVNERYNWYQRFGIRKENLRLRPHENTELAHYAKACKDVEYNFPIGWSELEGIANRTSFDLSQHIKHSGKDLSFFEEETKNKYVPFVIEPSAGVDRSTLAFLVDAYREEEVMGRKRVLLSLHYQLAPIKAAVFPLLTNRPEIVEKATSLSRDLKRHFFTVYDDSAGIGKLYRRQDEIGTPFCITVDVESLEDNKATVRDRDTMEQIRMPFEQVKDYIKNRLEESDKI